MNIVFVNPVGAIGGAERALLTILAALRNAQPNIQLYLIVGTDGLLVESARELGVQVEVLKLPDQVLQLGDSALKGSSRLSAGFMLLWQGVAAFPAFMQYMVKFRKAIREINPDLIHTNGIKVHLLTGVLGSKCVPVVWHMQDFYSSRPLMAQALRWVSDRVTGGIAISEAVARDARATLCRLPIEVIYSAVDVDRFSPKPTDLTLSNSPFNRLTSSVDTIRVGLVATFARWKGHDIFLNAAARIIRDRPELNIRFYIVGGAIYQTKGSQFSERELRELAAVLQIEDNVEFVGFQQNIADIYRWLDIVVHASTQPEPFGLAIVEAMACGKPVIVSQSGGAVELFTHNHDAVGVQPGNSTALASTIQSLVDNPCLCQRLSENARNTVLKRFSHDRLGEQILAAYNKFVAVQHS